MRSSLLICLTALLSQEANAEHGWALGVQAGTNVVQGPDGAWAAGPAVGLHVQRALPSGAEWQVLVRTSRIRQREGASLFLTPDGAEVSADDAISIHNHIVTGLRYAPLPFGDPMTWAFGPHISGGVGLNVLRTHTDLATPSGPGRITNTESALLVQAGLGLRSARQHTLVIDAGLTGQMFATFDRGERGGGDRIGVFFGLLPGVELSGQF